MKLKDKKIPKGPVPSGILHIGCLVFLIIIIFMIVKFYTKLWNKLRYGNYPKYYPPVAHYRYHLEERKARMDFRIKEVRRAFPPTPCETQNHHQIQRDKKIWLIFCDFLEWFFTK